MESLIIGIAASFNLLIIYWEIESKRYFAAILDGSILFILNAMFSHSTSGAVIATIASAVASLVILIKKPVIPVDDVKLTSFIAEFKTRMPKQ